MADRTRGLEDDLRQNAQRLPHHRRNDQVRSLDNATIQDIKLALQVEERDEGTPDKSVLRLSLELNVSIRFTRIQLLLMGGKMQSAQETLDEAFYIANAIEDEFLQARCSLWAGLIFAANGDDRLAAKSFLDAIHIVDRRIPESRIFIEVLHEFRPDIEHYVAHAAGTIEDRSEILRVFRRIMDDVQPPQFSTGFSSRHNDEHISFNLERLGFLQRNWLHSQESRHDLPRGSEASRTHIHQPRTNTDGASNRSRTSSRTESSFEKIDDFLRRRRDPQKYGKTPAKRRQEARQRSSRRVDASSNDAAGPSNKPIEGQKSPNASLAQASTSVVLNDARKDTDGEQEQVGTQEQPAIQDQTANQQHLAPADVDLSDTLALEELDKRVRITTGRRRSTGADLPAALKVATPNITAHVDTDTHLTSSPRAKTEPMTPSPLRRSSLPE